MKKNISPKKNYIYSLIYQVLILIIPLITAPYLSRVIGVDGVGTYSYTYSIVYYFVLLTMLGVNNYGNRSVAKVRDNKDELSKTFWSIYLFQFFSGIIMLIIYLLYILIFDNNYRIIALIQSLFIVSAMIDINWLFFGLEEFKKTIIRNTVVKISNVLLIFLLVKTVDDLWKYTLIMAGMTCIGQLMLWGFVRKKISFVKVKFKDIIKHIKPNLVLFIPVIAVSLYKMMDKVMIGGFIGVTEVGLYENAEKIINVPLAIITALGTVMLPRISNIISNGENEKVKEYIEKSIKFVLCLSFAMCAGLLAIGYDFAPLYFGKSFQKSGILIMMLAITLPFISFANVLRTQYLIPMEKDKIYLKSVSYGAIINLIINFLLIPQYGSIGACIGTIIAEISVMIYQTIAVKNDLDIKLYFKKSIPFLLKAIVMFIIVYSMNYLNINNSLRLIIQILMGCIIYGILNIRYFMSIIDIKKIINKLKKGDT